MTCGYFEPGFRAGGPIRSVAQIIDTISDRVNLRLITSDRDIHSSTPYDGLSGNSIARGRSRIHYVNTRSPYQIFCTLRSIRARPLHLLYLNSLWSPTFTALPIIATMLGAIKTKLIVIAPRGELSHGAMSFKSRKKQLALKLWGFALQRMRVEWHATADLEALEIKAAFPWAKIYTIPNQTNLPDEPLRPQARIGTARFVFIGRISPMKNLDAALRALSTVASPLEFDIYGPIEDEDYWAKCTALIADLPVRMRVAYRGELPPAQVRKTFFAYDAFLFPTRGENFGHVIAESLSASCPVICSEYTPWTDTLRAGGGGVIDPLVDSSLASHIESLADMTPEHRLKARLRAGAAYKDWHRNTSKSNIIDVIREETDSSKA
jgi:glycosyltransferase involved in cell wall biosynthesis